MNVIQLNLQIDLVAIGFSELIQKFQQFCPLKKKKIWNHGVHYIHGIQTGSPET